MPEEVTTDDTFLSRSQWENDFDLIKGLNETTAVGYYPKIAERILPDDTIIPSPINSCVNSQDIEMTSKTNFISKNPAPSVVVVSPKKKRKMVNVMNNQQEVMPSEMKGGKNSLFRKSVAGKENQDFDVQYAESEASNLTTATVDTPAKHFKMTDDSLDLTLTEAIINVKKSMFMKKKSSVNIQFNESKDGGNESDLRKDTDCQPISMPTTAAALRYPEDDDMHDVNKSLDQPEDVESDVSKTPEDTLASESAIMSPKTENAKSNRKSLFVRRSARIKEKSFNVPFEQTITTSDSLSNQTSNDLSLNISAKTQSSSKKSKAERNIILFQKKNKDEGDPFNVSCNETNSFRNLSKNDSLVEKESVDSPCRSDFEGSINEKSSAVSPLRVYGTRNRSHQKLVEESPVSSVTANRTLDSSIAQSSFNDDNLNGEEDQPETVPTTEIPSLIPLKEKPVISNNIKKVVDWEEKFKDIVEKARRGEDIRKKKIQPLPQEKKKSLHNNKNLNKSPRLRLKKPAPYATKRLYKFLIHRLQPKFGMDATIRAEELVGDICETVKIVIRKKTYQKKLINGLKIDMAKLGIIETTNDFYNFIRNFLLESFRKKSIPRIQPITCEIWPPQDVANPFDKIL